MAGIIIANKDENISISAPGFYGADFSLSVYSYTDNTWKILNKPMAEIIDAVEPASTSIDEVYHKGSASSIKLLDCTSFNIKDVVQIKNFLYKITDIDYAANYIKIHIPIKEKIEILDSVERVGNMGIYNCQINLETPGQYILKAVDSVFNMSKTDSLNVTEKSIKDMYSDIKNLELAILGSL